MGTRIGEAETEIVVPVVGVVEVVAVGDPTVVGVVVPTAPPVDAVGAAWSVRPFLLVIEHGSVKNLERSPSGVGKSRLKQDRSPG